MRERQLWRWSSSVSSLRFFFDEGVLPLWGDTPPGRLVEPPPLPTDLPAVPLVVATGVTGLLFSTWGGGGGIVAMAGGFAAGLADEAAGAAANADDVDDDEDDDAGGAEDAVSRASRASRFSLIRARSCSGVSLCGPLPLSLPPPAGTSPSPPSPPPPACFPSPSTSKPSPSPSAKAESLPRASHIAICACIFLPFCLPRTPDTERASKNPPGTDLCRMAKKGPGPAKRASTAFLPNQAKSGAAAAFNLSVYNLRWCTLVAASPQGAPPGPLEVRVAIFVELESARPNSRWQRK